MTTSKLRCSLVASTLASAVLAQDPVEILDLQTYSRVDFDLSEADVNDLRDRGWRFADVEIMSTSPNRYAVVIAQTQALGLNYDHRWQSSMDAQDMADLQTTYGVPWTTTDFERNGDGSYTMASSFYSSPEPTTTFLQGATEELIAQTLGFSPSLRILDIEPYDTPAGIRFDVLIFEDPNGIPWSYVTAANEEVLLAEIAGDPHTRIIDWERRSDGLVCAVTLQDSGKSWVVTGVSQEALNQIPSAYGARIVDLEKNGALWDVVLLDNLINHDEYGTACGNLKLEVVGYGQLGGTLTFVASNLNSGAIPALLLGREYASISADFLGATGCSLMVGAVFRSELLPTSWLGSAKYAAEVPDLPELIGVVLHSQVLAIDIGANALGVIASNGIFSRIRAR